VRAHYPETPDARKRTRKVAITIPGWKWTSLAEAVPRAEFAFVNAYLVLFAAGRERARVYSILVLISGLLPISMPRRMVSNPSIASPPEGGFR